MNSLPKKKRAVLYIYLIEMFSSGWFFFFFPQGHSHKCYSPFFRHFLYSLPIFTGPTKPLQKGRRRKKKFDLRSPWAPWWFFFSFQKIAGIQHGTDDLGRAEIFFLVPPFHNFFFSNHICDMRRIVLYSWLYSSRRPKIAGSYQFA